MPSVLASAPFVKHTLTYVTPSSTPGAADAFGNPTYASSTGTVTAFVSVDRAAQLHRLPGSDEEVTPVTIELLNPLALPANVGVGSVLTLTWAGNPSRVTVTSVTPNDIVGVPFGSVLRGELRRA